jgi:ribosome-associated protein
MSRVASEITLDRLVPVASRAGSGHDAAMPDRDDDRTARQIARGKRRKAGDRSARLATALMKLPAPALKKLELDEELRETIERARAVTAHIARRRAERTLAGELRRFDLPELDDQLARIDEAGSTDAQQFHLAETWRARLLEGGVAAAATFPGGVGDELPRLIDAAQRERATGRPPGAARALFRHIATALKTARAAED